MSQHMNVMNVIAPYWLYWLFLLKFQSHTHSWD